MYMTLQNKFLFGKSLEDKLIHHRLQDFDYDESSRLKISTAKVTRARSAN